VRIRDFGVVVVLAVAFMAACASNTTDGSGSFESNRGEEGAVTDETQVEGVSREALDEARAELEARIASGSIAGGAHMVVRNGKVIYFHVAGVDDIEDRTPLQADSIVRIYSMTKPIVSVAAMTLWEQDKFELDDPVAKFIPAFENARVLVEQGDSHEMVLPERPVTCPCSSSTTKKKACSTMTCTECSRRTKLFQRRPIRWRAFRRRISRVRLLPMDSVPICWGA
jgi:hypothetical protein